MKKWSPLEIVAAAGILYYIGDKVVKNIINRISFGKPIVSFQDISFGNINFDVKLPVTNKNNFSADIQGFEGTLSYGDILLANLSLPALETLAANETTILHLDAADPINGTFADLIDLVTNGNVLQSIRLKGRVKVGEKWWTVNQTIQIL